jgi:hypothetical protein
MKDQIKGQGPPFKFKNVHLPFANLISLIVTARLTTEGVIVYSVKGDFQNE